MCFSVKATLFAQLERAVKNKDQKQINEVYDKLKIAPSQPGFHLSGFTHPKLLVYTSENELPRPCFWGLIPHWVKDRQQIPALWNKTLNARIESILEKPSFKDSVHEKRCLIYVDGFYEFHHFKGKSYPFFISSLNKKPLVIAGLWSEWFDRKNNQVIDSFTIVTTKANALMAKIHNNPKKNEPRTPLILNETDTDFWLNEKITNQKFIEEIQNLHTENFLKAHSVQKLSGKSYLGNQENVSEEYIYPELETNFN